MFRKGDRHKRDLIFTTKPLPIRFQVSQGVYSLFKELFMEDVYEIDELVDDLPTAPVVIDIGANVGFFDIQLLSKIDKATIYAYEPVPANVKTLQQTLRQNPRLEQSVHLFSMAVTGQPLAQLELFAEAEENNQVVASAFSNFHENNSKKITVPCVTLTDIIQENGLQAIDLLKMDCEGSEYDIMYHTSPELIKRIRKMMIEVHDLDKEDKNIKAFNQYVQSLGYTTNYSPINSFCYALEATQQ
ncbi:FkbM family methyltransferase [Spirosoma validum]|uniref:FkbM family methyltransferase n=1 Tax=Spirosoma validum TaxID=2771355 RepID=A0A927GBX7_9BACT|nr:FkbM family methyltransferase [Spirosoma validum]MBD2751945.1 FkbM family methyltransferase [Spirosoma validum]